LSCAFKTNKTEENPQMSVIRDIESYLHYDRISVKVNEK